MLRSNIPPLFFSSNEWQTIFDVVLYNRLLSIWMIMNCKVPNKYKVCVLRMEAKGLQFDINGMERLFEFACHRRLILHLRLCCYNLNAIPFSFSLSLSLNLLFFCLVWLNVCAFFIQLVPVCSLFTRTGWGKITHRNRHKKMRNHPDRHGHMKMSMDRLK